MSDMTKSDNRNVDRVAGGEDYEINFLVGKAIITRGQARTLIKRYGNDRALLMKHARSLNA